jgi:hypothetical protein
LVEEKPRKDVDEAILNFFAGRSLSPRALSHGCQSMGVSRATYFRHKKKLLNQLHIEQLEKIDEDGKVVKLLRAVPPQELADSRDIEELLEEIENPDEVISSRGIRDLGRLCENHRVAYYFSPKNSARFKTKEDIEIFERNLLHGTRERRFQFLQVLYHMFDLEQEGSLWKSNLIQHCHNPIKKMAWEESDIEIRIWSIKTLMRISNEPLFDLGYSIIKDTIDDQDFGRLRDSVKNLLIRRKPAMEKRYEIRQNLNKLAIENAMWKKRVEMILV